MAPTSHAQHSIDGLLPEANRDFQFDYSDLAPIKFESFEAVAAWADVVAIAQVVNIDYEQTRELNAKGQAFLNVHVPYKGVKRNELLIVSSKGFEPHSCYYPDRIGEGERFLVFLKKSENDGEYHGFNPYCQLQILLTDTGEYALRYPLTLDFEISSDLVRPIQYNDPNAQIDATEWTGISREQHQKEFGSILKKDADMFQKFFHLSYTQGVMIYEIRKLMKIKAKARISSKQI
ncbi:hypothetical protein MNBD_GAMMA02-1730 [hydrothermal vent metagenome]|uniref:Uncharacterized protein n=1 Tax=hydrothermal vent metagenome TaxID=652676 RepID=A0A3B0WTS4_9ZZZZ